VARDGAPNPLTPIAYIALGTTRMMTHTQSAHDKRGSNHMGKPLHRCR